MDGVFLDRGTLAVALLGYCQQRRACAGAARANDIVVPAQLYAAHADGGSAHWARILLVEADGHTVVRCDEDVLVAAGLDDGDKLVALVKIQRSYAVCADVLQRGLAHALDGAVARDKDKVAVLIQSAAADHCGDLLLILGAVVHLDYIHQIRAARGAAGLRNIIALLDIYAAGLGEEQNIIVRGRSEHGLHEVLVLRRHRADALAAAPLGAVLTDGQALDIAAVGQRKDALLLFDKILHVDLIDNVLYLGAALVAVLIAQRDKLIFQNALDKLGVGKQALEISDFLFKLLVLKLQLLAVESLKRDKAHITYRLRLNVAQAEALHQILLRVVVAGADDVDDLVDIVLRDEQAFQQMSALLGLAQIVARAADDDVLLEGQVLVDNVAQGQYLRLTLIIHERQHIYREAGLQRSLREQPVQHDLRVCVALELNDHAHTVAVALVAQVGNALKALFAHLICDILDELALIDLIRQLVDDYSGSAVAPELLKLRARADNDSAAAGGVCLTYAAAPHDDALGREIRAFDVLHKVGQRRFRIIQHADAGVYDLGEVVRRDIRRHADGDTAGAVDQQVRESGGQDARLLAALVKVRIPVDGLFVDVAQHLVGYF